MDKSYSCQHNWHNECQDGWCACWCHPFGPEEEDYELMEMMHEQEEQDYLAEFLEAFPQYKNAE